MVRDVTKFTQNPKMADEDDLPPPLPSSPPPMVEDIPESPVPSSSDKFHALQARIGSSRTMYGPSQGGALQAAPPTNRQQVDPEEDEGAESPAMTHYTKDRPRRKVRAPSRTSLRQIGQEPPGWEGGVSPPAPPTSAPPPIPPPEPATSPPEQQTRMEDLNDYDSHSGSHTPDVSSLGSTSSLGLGSGSRPGSGTEAKRLAIGSFSDRLKRIRQNRTCAARATSPTPAEQSSDSSFLQLHSSPLRTPTRPPPTDTTPLPTAFPTPTDAGRSPRKQAPPPVNPKPTMRHRTSKPVLATPERMAEAPPFDLLGDHDSPPTPPSSPPPVPSSSPPVLPLLPAPAPPTQAPPSSVEQGELMSKLNKWKRRSECLDHTEELSFVPKPPSAKEEEEEPVEVKSNRRSVSELISKFNVPSKPSDTLPESPPPLPATLPPTLPPPSPPSSPPPTPTQPTPEMPAVGPDEQDTPTSGKQGMPNGQAAPKQELQQPKMSAEETRVRTTAAVRTSDAKSLPVLKKWSTTTLAKEPDKPPSAPPPSSRGLSRGTTPPTESPPPTYRSVKVISDGGTLNSPDLKFTRVAMKRWNKPVPDDLFASASAGDILGGPRKSSLDGSDLQKASSLMSFGSSSESLGLDDTQRSQKTLSPLVVSRAKQGGGAAESLDSVSELGAKEPAERGEVGVGEKDSKHRSSFVQSVLGSIPPMSSSQENLQRKVGEEEAYGTHALGGKGGRALCRGRGEGRKGEERKG